ncbi:MAG: hypothetical protein ACERKO_07510, partial [Acetanaerobacterium sp.]
WGASYTPALSRCRLTFGHLQKSGLFAQTAVGPHTRHTAQALHLIPAPHAANKERARQTIQNDYAIDSTVIIISHIFPV